MTLLIDSLSKVYFCTGARNHELLAPLSKNKLAFEYDERMASFKALGFIKAQEAPVAVCTTSGTAVAECVPAMLEAYYSKLPLILISGDRPKKLHGTGAPQTIEHELLTRGSRGSYFEMDLTEFLEFKMEDVEYPVHINVLIDDTTSHDQKIIHHKNLAAFRDFLQDKKSPLFIFSHESRSMLPLVEKFTALKIPFYAESMSGARHLSSLSSERDLVTLFNQGAFDCIIRIGHTPLTKIWRLLERNPLPVLNFDERGMPGLSFGEVLTYSSHDLLQSPIWWETLSSFQTSPLVFESKDLGPLMEKYPESEISLMRNLQNELKEDDVIYLGNSLIIRFFELTQAKKFLIFGNRGVNGIDGQLASAIGLAEGTKKTVYCILGDVTTLYDLSSMREMPGNLKLIIMNNKGGRIFDMLKLDKRIVMEHGLNFLDISQGFKLKYTNDLKELDDTQVLELFPNQDHTARFLQEWNS